MGDSAPALKLAAERAIAAVAEMPPKKGVTKLPMPCPNNSLLALWRFPVMPSNTTAHKSDSIAPNMAIANAAGSKSRNNCQLICKLSPLAPACNQGHSNCGNTEGIPDCKLPSLAR